jgi:signal transduction histidine kinase
MSDHTSLERSTALDKDSPASPPQPAASAGNAARQGSLFRKYLFLILSLVALAVVVSGAVSVYFSYQENKAALASLQHEKAVAAASRIEQYVRQIAQQLDYAALPQLEASDLDSRHIELLKVLRQAPEITDISYLDAAGREQVTVSRLGMDVVGSGRDRSGEPGFRNARRGQPWFGPVYFRKDTEPYMTVAVRAGGDRGPVTIAEMNLKFIWDVVSRIRIGDKGKAYVVDAGGFLVADPDIGLVLRKTNLSGLAHVRAMAANRSTNEPAMVSHDFAGTAVLSSMAPIEPLGWMVFVEQPVSEVYEKLNASIARTALLLLAGLVTSALAALALARGMVRPIRTLNEGAKRIGAGDLDQHIVVQTGDELQGLAEQFNRMAAQLRDSYAGLERKVDERTAQLKEALEQQTATGEILGVISNSVADAGPVFDMILDSCKRLFASHRAVIALVGEDGKLHLAAYKGDAPETAKSLYPQPLEDTAGGLAIRERRVLYYPDMLDTPEVPTSLRQLGQRVGNQSLVLAPMLWEDRGIGCIAVARAPYAAFSAKEMSLLKTFADQAVIAVQNARLFHEIQAKSRQLEISDKHKSEFLANMSHELRTPLNAVIGFSDVLLERIFGDLNDKQDEFLHDIRESGRHLLNLINDILDLSKIEAGRMDLDVSDFDARLAISNALTLVRERAQRHGVALALEMDPQVGTFRADERKLKQILLNLLSNAVKFTPTGGRIEVHSRIVDGHALEVTVADTGIGIAKEDHEAVFEEFRQVGRHYTNKQEGTGLGLALTRRFVELHGGSIRLESVPGAGSTFTVILPGQA